MGLFGNLYDKRKAKLTASAAPFLDGEAAATSAICQSDRQSMQAAFGKQGYEQFLATATGDSFYVFAISPVKNEVFGDSRQMRPLATLEARMEGRRAVIGEFRLAPLRVDEELEELVAFVQERGGHAR